MTKKKIDTVKIKGTASLASLLIRVTILEESVDYLLKHKEVIECTE